MSSPISAGALPFESPPNAGVRKRFRDPLAQTKHELRYADESQVALCYFQDKVSPEVERKRIISSMSKASD